MGAPVVSDAPYTMRGTPLVTLTNVSAGYHHAPVIHDVGLTIMRGDFVGLVGPSGAGKTTLLRAILGAVEVFEGHVQIADAQGHAARAGYVPQINSVDWHFPVTVEEVVMMGLASPQRTTGHGRNAPIVRPPLA